MSQSQVDRLHKFEPFDRLDREQHCTGSGLGLPLSKHLVEQMGGSLEVESIEHKGTKVSILLPWDPSVSTQRRTRKISYAAPPKEFQATLPLATKISRLRVLAIEDNDQNYHLLRNIFSLYFKISLDWARTAKEAYQAITRTFTSSPYHWLLVDYRLPDANGREVLTILRQKGVKAPFFLITANPMSKFELRRFKRLGMREYFVKPIEVGAFVEACQEGLMSLLEES